MLPYVEEMREAAQNEELPHIYVNGFSISVGNSDASLLLKFHEKPVLFISMSHIIAKTLAEKFGAVIADMEDITDRRIFTTDQLTEILISEEQIKEEDELK
jgi:hypothetical protein